MISAAPPDVEHGLFAQRISAADFTGRPCLFLDRDGVQVEETNYLHKVEDIALIEGVAEAVAQVNRLGIAVVMVTNQAGIGRGYYTWKQFQVVQDAILEGCRAAGGHYDMVLACAYHADGIEPYRLAAHPWRKPQPGMLLEAARILGVDLSRSHIIGDTLTDLAAGAQAGLPGGTLVRTGHGEREWRDRGEAVFATYRESGRFVANLAENAGEAIDAWLMNAIPRGNAA